MELPAIFTTTHGLVGTIGAVLGAGGVTLYVIPKVIVFVKEFKEAIDITTEFFTKYKALIMTSAKDDFKAMATEWDHVTETAADIAAKFKMSKTESFLRGIISRQWLDGLK